MSYLIFEIAGNINRAAISANTGCCRRLFNGGIEAVNGLP